MLITSEADLDAALLAKDPYLWVDGSTELELTDAKLIDYPATVHGGRYYRPDGPAFLATSDDVTITGARFTGGRVNNDYHYSQAQKLVYVLGQEGEPLHRVQVAGNSFADSRGDNVWMQWTEDSQVVGNNIHDYRYSAIMGISNMRMQAHSNTITDGYLIAEDGEPVNVYGIAFTDADNTEQSRSRDCSAVGNMITRVDWEGLDTHGGDGVQFSANTVVGCPTGITFVTGNQTRIAGPTRALCTGNMINAAGSRVAPKHGVWLGGNAGHPGDGTVVGNQINGYANPYGLDYVDRSRLRVEANSVDFVPWTPVTMGVDFNPNPVYTPRFKVDGNTVTVWGMVIPKAARKIVGRINSTWAWPDKLTFFAESHGSGGDKSSRVAFAVWGSDSDDYPPGTIQAFYPDSPWTDGYSYPMFGTYQAI